MPVPSDLQTRITANFEHLSPKQRAIARLILDHRYFISFASAAEIGAKVDASAATVVRFCQVLGYEGLPDLQEAIRQELPTYVTAVERLERRLGVKAADGQVLQRVFATDVANMERTVSSVSAVAFDEATSLLAAANEILIVASGVTAAPAFFLAHSLQVMGKHAQAVTDGDIALSISLAHVTNKHVVIGIGVWRYVRSTVDGLRQARERGASIVAVTDSVVSPLAREADIAFEVATDGVAHSLSMTALMALLNALVAGVSLCRAEQTGEALRRVERAFKDRNLLLME
jgi:DNA-binding MurR/RpiR family transcriptional regulator